MRVIEYLDRESKVWYHTEQKFQDAYDNQDEETMFKCMHRIAYFTCQKRATKLNLLLSEDDIFDRSLDATMVAYSRMKRLNQRPKKLTGYLSWPVFEVFHGPKVRRQEVGTVSLDSMLDKGYDPVEESFEDKILDKLEKEGY